MGVFNAIGTALEQASTSMISTSVSSIISAITPAVTTGVIIYFMITGYMVLAGRISEPIGDVCIKAAKIAIVSTLFLSTGGIMSYVVSGVNGIESMFVNAITGGGSANTFQTLDDILDKSIDSAANCINQAENLSWTDTGQIFAYYLTGIAVAVGALIMTVFRWCADYTG